MHRALHLQFERTLYLSLVIAPHLRLKRTLHLGEEEEYI
jgi:hypothetical protein